MFRLFVDRISYSMVFLLHDSLNFGPSVGTGFLVGLGGHTYIASALHNFAFQGEGPIDVLRTWNETKFKFRDKGPLQFRESLDIPEEEFVLLPGVTLSADSSMLIDKKRDLIAVRVEPGGVIPRHVYPVELKEGGYTGEIESGASLITVGMPFAGRVKLRSGPTVFYPHTDHVRFDPNISPVGLPHSYDPKDHILYRYSNELEGIGPKGYSGAPVWSNNSGGPESIWSVQPAIVGIALEYYKKRQLIQAVRIKHLLDLLQSELISDQQ